MYYHNHNKSIKDETEAAKTSRRILKNSKKTIMEQTKSCDSSTRS